MIKVEVKALAGFEQEFENFNVRKQNLAKEIEDAKAAAIAKVEADYANTSNRIDNLIAQVSETVEVEVADVVEDANQIVAEEQPENLGE